VRASQSIRGTTATPTNTPSPSTIANLSRVPARRPSSYSSSHVSAKPGHRDGTRV
jgi:hypothetical protein